MPGYGGMVPPYGDREGGREGGREGEREREGEGGREGREMNETQKHVL